MADFHSNRAGVNCHVEQGSENRNKRVRRCLYDLSSNAGYVGAARRIDCAEQSTHCGRITGTSQAGTLILSIFLCLSLVNNSPVNLPQSVSVSVELDEIVKLILNKLMQIIFLWVNYVVLFCFIM
jgi:hypothetical protein